MKKSSKTLAYDEYLRIIDTLREKIKPGDKEDFCRAEGISYATLNNALNGYYMRNGIKIMYKPLDILEAFVNWLQAKSANDERRINELAEKVGRL